MKATSRSRPNEALRNIGARAPQPTLGQSVNDYRRETLRTIKRTFLQNHELGKINCRGLASDALGVFEPQLLAAAKVEAFNPASVAPGEFRMITKRDPNNGQEVRDFIGPRHFTWDMTRVRGRTTLREMQRRADILRTAK
jgi:hypothetical protein